MSVVHVSKESVAGTVFGSGTATGEETRVTTLSLPVTKHVVIRSDSQNMDDILIGNPGNVENGFVLHPGDEIKLNIQNTDDVALIGVGGDQAFSWIKT